MTEIAVERSAPQHKKPTPMGKIPGGVSGMGKDWRVAVASLRSNEKFERSVPSPRKPSPPALETATARGVVEIQRMGAEEMRGDAAHG
jgi:hypothetical protein